MKTALLIFLGIGVGWFTRAALDAASICDDWRHHARWAAFAIFDIVALLIIDRFIT